MGETSRETRAIRTGIGVDPAYRSIVPPIYLSSTFAFDGYEKPGPYDYTRSSNPTRNTLAEALTQLEGGAGGVVTSTGMAGMTLILAAFVSVGERIVVPHDCYGGSWRLFDSLAGKGHFTVDYVDFNDSEAVAAALHTEPAPRIAWLETPSNPLLRITDIAAVAERAHAVGALVVADNTFLSPALQQPISLGADIVHHSTTKYIGGHSDVVGGAVVAATAELHEQLDWWNNVLGTTGGPFDSYLTLRGLRTLFPRMRQHQANAAALVEVLERHPAVTAVNYPGRPDHPGHAVAARQQQGFGAMVSFDLRGGTQAVRRFVDGLTCMSLAESLGGVETLVAHPRTMTHASMTPQAWEIAGIGEGLVRISVGIEAESDLVADLTDALDRAAEG